MDDLYKKMILALPEDFFTDWQWHIGDKALCLDSLSRGEVIIMDGICHGLVKVAWVDRIFLETEQECIDRLRPVPSQKQLQSIIKQHWLKSDDTVKDYDVLVFFQDWFRVRYGSSYTYGLRYKEIENESIDCIWLRYTMHVIYNKNWNGEAWI